MIEWVKTGSQLQSAFLIIWIILTWSAHMGRHEVLIQNTGLSVSCLDNSKLTCLYIPIPISMSYAVLNWKLSWSWPPTAFFVYTLLWLLYIKKSSYILAFGFNEWCKAWYVSKVYGVNWVEESCEITSHMLDSQYFSNGVLLYQEHATNL